VEDQPTPTNVVFEDAGFDAQFVRAVDTIPSGGAALFSQRVFDWLDTMLGQ